MGDVRKLLFLVIILIRIRIVELIDELPLFTESTVFPLLPFLFVTPIVSISKFLNFPLNFVWEFTFLISTQLTVN